MIIPKYGLRGLYLIALLALLVTVMLPASALAAEIPTTTATVTVEGKLSGDTPPTAATFYFTLTPDDESCPMPEGTDGDTVKVLGKGTASFDAITYSEPNTYTYTLKETAGNAANYSYDKSVYKVSVYVTTDDDGKLTATVWMSKDGTDSKSANAVFENSYKGAADATRPQTGDESDMMLWVALEILSFTALLTIIFFRAWRNKNRG